MANESGRFAKGRHPTAEEGPGGVHGYQTGAIAFLGGLGMVGGTPTHIIKQRAHNRDTEKKAPSIGAGPSRDAVNGEGLSLSHRATKHQQGETPEPIPK